MVKVDLIVMSVHHFFGVKSKMLTFKWLWQYDQSWSGSNLNVWELHVPQTPQLKPHHFFGVKPMKFFLSDWQ